MINNLHVGRDQACFEFNRTFHASKMISKIWILKYCLRYSKEVARQQSPLDSQFVWGSKAAEVAKVESQLTVVICAKITRIARSKVIL